MAVKLPNPLGGPPPPEVSLPHAPLARVLAQVRFPDILKIDSKDAAARIQEEIRHAYPLFEQQASQQMHLQIGVGEPIVRQVPANVWRFIDADKNWRVSLTTALCTLECDRYSSRNDFMARWSEVVSAVERTFNPRFALRIGLRYINRVVGEALDNIQELVRPGILGLVTPEIRQHVLHHLTEATLAVEEGEMLLRWGALPANATIDPSALRPVRNKSWILDIDVYSNTQREFVSKELDTLFRALAEREYSVFRFVTTDTFLRTYGATV